MGVVVKSVAWRATGFIYVKMEGKNGEHEG